MDIFSSYIQNGKGNGFKKFFFISFLTSVLFSLLIWQLSSFILRDETTQVFFNSLPKSEIRNGLLTTDSNTAWKGFWELANLNVNIDSSITEPQTQFSSDGLYLTRDTLYAVQNGLVQSAPYSFDLTINPDTLNTFFKQWLTLLSVLSGITVFIALLIGFGATIALTMVILPLFKKDKQFSQISRASLICWFAIALLDFCLLLAGYGFSLTTGILFATMLNLICLIKQPTIPAL